jgi:hypothetical protein
MRKVDLRKEARGRECQVRLPYVCNGNPETTVLAHFRLIGMSGMGMKPPDLFGSWCCSAFHDVVDRRKFVAELDPGFIRLAHALGVFRTQAILLEEGKLSKVVA